MDTYKVECNVEGLGTLFVCTSSPWKALCDYLYCVEGRYLAIYTVTNERTREITTYDVAIRGAKPA